MKRADEHAAVSQSILRYANRGATRIDFLSGVCNMLLDFSGADGLELRLFGPDLCYRWELAARPQPVSRFAAVVNGSRVKLRRSRWGARTTPGSDGIYSSVALIPFSVDDSTAGLLQLKSLRPKFFSSRRLQSCERIAEVLGPAMANQRAQWALRERVKELTCLYGIGRITQLSGITLDQALQQIVDLLPPAWQFPEIACGRIQLDHRSFISAGFSEGPHRQQADLTINGKRRGSIQVVYTKERPEFAEGPFLTEERSLIDTIAREVELLIERRETEQYQAMLQAQLRHADRLATIGQLAAGVAHELNEPIGGILGFAQLIQKYPDLPDGAARDAERIVKASLHAREVIHKLLVFSRQKTPVKARVNLNHIVEEGLYFLESRCAKTGIALVSDLAPHVPDICADASQLHQVLVNLVVNSIQAMPEGGTLTIETRGYPDSVSLAVRDTGVGMTDEVKEKIYTPFFTTKDIDQGTGLGLAVVHGIVTAHGGTIDVESSPGKGARFEIRLPAVTSDE